MDIQNEIERLTVYVNSEMDKICNCLINESETFNDAKLKLEEAFRKRKKDESEVDVFLYQVVVEKIVDVALTKRATRKE